MKYGHIYWFTGLSGSGKTTISKETKNKLTENGYSIHILDGDVIRGEIHNNLSFSTEDIKINNKLILDLCLEKRNSFDVIFVTIISPYKSSRKLAREKAKNRFYEIYCKADIEVLVSRDPKGLYKKAMNGKIKNLIGFSTKSKYEAPENPDLILDSTNESVDESTDKLLNFITNNFNLNKSINSK